MTKGGLMQNWRTAVGFGAAICSLTTLMIPAMSITMAAIALVFFFLSSGDTNKGMRWSILGMAVLALLGDLIYFLIT